MTDFSKKIILYDLKTMPHGSTGHQLADIARERGIIFYTSEHGGRTPEILHLDDSKANESCGIEVVDVFYNEELFLKTIST